MKPHDDALTKPPAPGTPSGRAAPLDMLARSVGLVLMLGGDILIIAALFAPWIVAYKISDPDFPTPQMYSPWVLLHRARLDALGVVAGLYFLLTAATVLTPVYLPKHAPQTGEPLWAASAPSCPLSVYSSWPLSRTVRVSI